MEWRIEMLGNIIDLIIIIIMLIYIIVLYREIQQYKQKLASANYDLNVTNDEIDELGKWVRELMNELNERNPK
jgi:hypothetical protein